MSQLADLHEAGHLLAAGPLFDDRYRGLSILAVEPDLARELEETRSGGAGRPLQDRGDPVDDPGRRDVLLPARFPRSVAEASAD
jgi:uncharacterized protein